MKIKLTRGVGIHGVTTPAGTIIDVTDEMAKTLMSANKAELFIEPVAAPVAEPAAEPVIETPPAGELGAELPAEQPTETAASKKEGKSKKNPTKG